ncbi:MAG: hypothetical protein H6742_01745 [Alphaproteobacteria bacterium]|nr:hypothetical protein [Alphaproteobacteria bacterium]
MTPLVVPLLLACAADPCDVTTSLEWEEEGATGVSAASRFGDGVGSWTAQLSWQEELQAEVAAEEQVEAQVAALGAEETGGDPEQCPIVLAGIVEWQLTTDAGGITASGEHRWSAPVGGIGKEPKDDVSVGVRVKLSADQVGFAPVEADPDLTLTFSPAAGDDDRLSMTLTERWLLDELTDRECVRASTDPAALGCIDSERDPDDEGGDDDPETWD